MGIPVRLLGKLAQQGVAAGSTLYKYYTIANRLLDVPTTEAALRDLEQVVQQMSNTDRTGFTVALTALAKMEKQPERRQRQQALLRALPWGEAALKVSRSQAQAPAQRPQAIVATAPAPQHPKATTTAAPAPQPFKANKFEKYTHRGYDFTFPDYRRPVVSVWEEGSAEIARMRRIDLTDHPAGQWVTLRDWQNREVSVRARRDGSDVWLLKL